MNQTYNALDYIISSTHYVHGNDISRAFLAVCVDLYLPIHHDAFPYLRKAITLKTLDYTLRMNDIYQQIVDTFDSATDTKQVEVAIRSCIESFWKSESDYFWELFFLPKANLKERPSNRIFVSRMACYMELWLSSKEDDYATK